MNMNKIPGTGTGNTGAKIIHNQSQIQKNNINI